MSDKVTSLQEYITRIDQDFSNKFFFRGESKDFGPTKNMASGYRWILEKPGRSFQDLINMRCEYFRDIGAHLNYQEIENFITYAQHHGLPTELLDITENPLVALYFAISEPVTEDAIIYVFDDNKHNGRSNKRSQFLSNLNQSELFTLNGRKVENQYFDSHWSRSFIGHVGEDKSEPIDEFTKSLFIASDLSLINNAMSEQINSLYSEKDSVLNSELDFVKKTLKESADSFKLGSTFSIDELLRNQTNQIISDSIDLMRLSDGNFFPPLRYIHITPSIIFDRMRNQQGSFIYQLSSEYLRFGFINIQPIKEFASIVIDANSKEKILAQLDGIGINQKFIFSDDDNVAKYYSKNYDKKQSIEMTP